MPQEPNTTSQKPAKDAFSGHSTAVTDKLKTAGSRAASTRAMVNASLAEPTDTSAVSRPADALEPADRLEDTSHDVRAFTSDFNGLLTRIQAFQDEMWRTTRLTFEKLTLEMFEECQNVLVKLDTRLQERAHRQMSLISDAFDIEAESRLAARVDQAVEKVLVVERRVLNVLDEKLETGKAALDLLRQAVSEELDQRKSSFLNDFQIETSKSLDAMKSAHEKDLQKMADNQTGVLKEQLSKMAATSSEAFAGALRIRTEEISTQLEGRLVGISDAVLTRLSSEAESIVKRETSSHLIKALRSRLDQLALSLKE